MVAIRVVPELEKRLKTLETAGYKFQYYHAKSVHRFFVTTPDGWTKEANRDVSLNAKLDDVAYNSAVADLMGAAWSDFLVSKRREEIQKLLGKISAFKTTDDSDWYDAEEDYRDSDVLAEAIEEWQATIIRIENEEHFFK